MTDTAVQPISTDLTPLEEVVDQIAWMEGLENDQERPEMPPRGFISKQNGHHVSCSKGPPDQMTKALPKLPLTPSKSHPSPPQPLSHRRAKVLLPTAPQAKTTPLVQKTIHKPSTPLRSFLTTPYRAPALPIKTKSPPPSKAPFEQPIKRAKEGDKPRENKLKENQKFEERKEGVIEPHAQQREIEDPADKKHAMEETIEATEVRFEEIEAFANEIAPISDLVGEQITQRDILFLFFEILKLFQNSKELQKEARRVLRKEHLAHINRVVGEYEAQGNALLNAALRSSAFSIIGGSAPLAGPLIGNWFFDQLASWTGRFQNLTEAQRNEWYMWMAKSSQSAAEGQMKWGEAELRISEGGRSLDEAKGQLCRADEEECSRLIQEYLEQWRRISEFLDQYLRVQHDTATRL